jgi:hypothetical protein
VLGVGVGAALGLRCAGRRGVVGVPGGAAGVLAVGVPGSAGVDGLGFDGLGFEGLGVDGSGVEGVGEALSVGCATESTWTTRSPLRTGCASGQVSSAT